MPRQGEISRASGRDLISHAQDLWGETRDQLPHTQRQELGQVLTELSSRIDYTCQGQQPQVWSKYSTLGGGELASHAFKTVQKASQQLPVDASGQLIVAITEMANRVRYAAEGEPQGQSQNGFDFSREEKSQGTKQQQSVVFA